MEFKKLIAIFSKHIKFFWVTVVVCAMIGFIGQRLQTDAVVSNLTLNVTRLGADKTTEYQYHDFYRLQADERFADTVVRWLASPRMIADIDADTRLSRDMSANNRLTHAIKAERLSSQMIQVTYRAENEIDAKNTAQAIVRRVNVKIDALNKDQQEPSWFVIVGDDPVVQDARFGLTPVIALSLVLGVFLGFWVLLFRHYFSGSKKD